MPGNRVGIAATLAGQPGPDQGGQVTEDAQHEQQEEQVMSEILSTVKDIQQKLDALMQVEEKEQGNIPTQPNPASAD